MEEERFLKIETIQFQADGQVHLSFKYAPVPDTDDTLYTLFITGTKQEPLSFAKFVDLVDDYLYAGEESDLGQVMLDLVSNPCDIDDDALEGEVVDE